MSDRPRALELPVDDYDEDSAREWDVQAEREAAEPSNAASRAVAERAGFAFEGVLRSWHMNKGTRRDAAIYSLLRGELR